jgi:type IV secretion system protein VirB4
MSQMSITNILDRHLGLSFFVPKSEAEKDDAAELNASAELPFGLNPYYNDHTLRTIDDALVQIIRLQGLYSEMLDDDSVDIYKYQRNVALEAIADANVGIYVHEIRRKSARWPGGTYKNWWANYLNSRLRQRYERNPLYQHEIYITLVRYRHYKGVVGALDRVFNAFDLSGANGKLESQARQARDLEEKTQSLMKSLEHYAPRRLGRVDTDIGPCCEMARFLRYLLTLEDGPVLAPAHNLAQAIATSYLSFGTNPELGKDVFEARGIGHHRVGQVLAMSQWPDGASAGMCDRFQKVPAEVIVTQKFFPIDKLDANMASSTSEARLSKDRTTTTQAAQVAQLRQRQAANKAILGEHHMSVLVHVPVNGRAEEALDALDEAVSKTGECFKSLGVKPVVETAGMERAVWSQIPGATRRHNGRVGKIESVDFACFASLHTFPQGLFEGSLWGDCLLILPTDGLTGYAVTLHEERPGMVPGHVNVAALTGMGKTFLVGLLVSQADKAEPHVHWFDRENGATVLNQAMEGVDIVLSLTRSLGNPCKMPDSPQNRAMLRELLQMMATCYGGVDLDSDAIERIAKAVDDNFDDTKTRFEDRRLRNLAWRLGRKDSPLYKAIALWHSDGPNAAVFDNDVDTLDVTQHRHYRYEMRELIKDKEARPELALILNYLTHRIEQSLDGSPTIIVWDEAQLLVRNRFWQNKIETYRETFRRRNCVTVFITPDPAALYTPVEAVKKQAVTSFYLANDKAMRRDYIDNLDFSTSEFEFIKYLSPAEYKVLIKKGAHVSVRASFAVADMPEVVAVLSSNDKSVSLMEEIRSELGTTEPHVWVPVFMERALARRTHNI